MLDAVMTMIFVAKIRSVSSFEVPPSQQVTAILVAAAIEGLPINCLPISFF
jgi:hypothetical protein